MWESGCLYVFLQSMDQSIFKLGPMCIFKEGRWPSGYTFDLGSIRSRITNKVVFNPRNQSRIKFDEEGYKEDGSVLKLHCND